MFLAAVSSTTAAMTLIGNLISLIGYGFYLFGGVALVFCTLKYQQGNTEAMLKGFVGASLLFTAPTLLNAIVTLLG